MNTNSKELYINLKDKDIPFWNPLYPYEEQERDVQEFWQYETLKLMEGVTINGVFIHPWLYWHLNFWKIMSDIGDNVRVPIHPDLRDNEWFFVENLQRAEEENKGIFMFGTRRFGKALLNSEVLYMEDREVKIGDVLVGDRIYDESGKLVEVTGVYPQGRLMTYKVTFEDGRNVVCCGDHLWTVRTTGSSWTTRPLKEIMKTDYKRYSIPINKPIEYRNVKLPIPASAYGAMVASCLEGYMDDIPMDIGITRRFLRSSISQKKEFIESFLVSMQGVVTGDERILISNPDRMVVRFVLRMLWSYGYYARLDGNYLIICPEKYELGISSIEVYGKYNATCITVDNKSKLFLTTNYIVTHNSAIMASFLARNATMTYNLTHNVIGGSAEDLHSLSDYLEFGLDNMPPFLKIGRTSNNWSKGVVLGVKTVTNERDIHATIQITNLESGKTSASLKPAGGTPFTSIYDEVGKFPFLDAYLAGLPSHMQNDRMRGMILAAGCLTGDNIVYKANGESCLIKDLKQEDGILGYDVESGCIVPQKISWMKKPSLKDCNLFKIDVDGDIRELKCSMDHPIYCFNPDRRDWEYRGYVPAFLVFVGDEVCIIDMESGAMKKGTVVFKDYCGYEYVYNLTADGQHNYIANGILTHNTGGNVEKSQDAQKVMNNPSAYGFIVMDYDLLNKHVKDPTWRVSKSAVFVPGQMSYAYRKDDTTLDKYLEKENAPGLRRIKIKVTNFERATSRIKSDLDELIKGDRKLYIQKKMAYPLTPDDCFLNANVNRFPVEDALIHKNRILEQGRRGKAVDIFQLDNKRMGWNFSEKMIAGFPFEGGNIDAPVIIYEDPPEEGGKFDYTYVSSLDIYKSDKADTTSLGSFYVYKRMVGINDPFGNRIVASYASRPASSDDFCRTCEILQEAYGAMCLMENADRMYEMYLARRHKEAVLLENGEKLACRIIRPNSRQNNVLGLSPTVPNQRMLYNAVLQYCWEDVVVGYDEDGNEITQKGIYRIDDPELLDEIIAFGPGVNTDRIISFGHSLLLAKYYDDCNYWPESPTQRANREMREKHRYKEAIVNGIPIRRRRIFK